MPTKLGKYEIIREIARSNDIVYEAYDPVMHRRVAVKELAFPGALNDAQRQDRLKRFHREARAAGSLVHPNIVTIYEVEQEGDRHFIAMEYLDGQNLRQVVDSAGFLSPVRSVEIALEVLEGLKFAHANGVIHRDIKPDNIQILENGQIKLTDFGIARLTFEPNITIDGQVFGTPSYMSPEQINGKEIDVRSDLFSVGVILYEMLSGTKPFPGDSVVSITYAIMNREPDAIPQANHALWQVIRTALDKSPQLRYATADEMTAALKAVQASLMQVVVDPVAPPSAWQSAQVSSPYAPPAQVPPMSVPPVLYPPPVQSQGQYPPQAGTNYQPYNPYGTMPGGAPAYSQQVPAYYPPPPKQPLLKPATKQFLIRFMVALIVIATIFALILVGIQSLAEIVKQGNPAADVPKVRRPHGLEPTGTKAPPVVASDRASQPNRQPNQPNSVREQQSPPPTTPTEEPYDVFQAIAEAKAVVRLAMAESFSERRQELWAQSAEMFSKAMADAPYQSERTRNEAVQSYLTAAGELRNANLPRQAREALYRARGFAATDEVLTGEIARQIDELGG